MPTNEKANVGTLAGDKTKISNNNGKDTKKNRLPVNVLNLQQFNFEKITLSEVLLLSIFIVKAQSPKIGNPFKHSYKNALEDIGMKRKQYSLAVEALIERGTIELINTVRQKGKSNERQIKVLFENLNYEFWFEIVRRSPATGETREQVAAALTDYIKADKTYYTQVPEEPIPTEAITEPGEHQLPEIADAIRSVNHGLTTDEAMAEAQKYCAHYSGLDWKRKDGTPIKDFITHAKTWTPKRATGGGLNGNLKPKKSFTDAIKDW